MNGTPGFIFGTVTAEGKIKAVKQMSGASPELEFAKVLDPLLAAAAKSK